MTEVSWLTGADRFVLQFLAGHEEPGYHASPSVIASNVGYSAPHVRSRIGTLTDAGLLRRVDDGRGYYAITDLGGRLLAREITPGELRRLEGRGRRAQGEKSGGSETNHPGRRKRGPRD